MSSWVGAGPSRANPGPFAVLQLLMRGKLFCGRAKLWNWWWFNALRWNLLDIKVSLLLKDNLECICFYSGVAAWFIGSPAALLFVSHLQHKADLEQLFPMDCSPPKAGWSFMTLCFIPNLLNFQKILYFYMFMHFMLVLWVFYFKNLPGFFIWWRKIALESYCCKLQFWVGSGLLTVPSLRISLWRR